MKVAALVEMVHMRLFTFVAVGASVYHILRDVLLTSHNPDGFAWSAAAL